MFGDLDWPLNASRWFVSIGWASGLYFVFKKLMANSEACRQILVSHARRKRTFIINPCIKLSRPGNPVNQVRWQLLFLSPLVLPNSKAIPSTGRSVHAVGNVCNFRLISRQISELEQDTEQDYSLSNRTICDDLGWLWRLHFGTQRPLQTNYLENCACLPTFSVMIFYTIHTFSSIQRWWKFSLIGLVVFIQNVWANEWLQQGLLHKHIV